MLKAASPVRGRRLAWRCGWYCSARRALGGSPPPREGRSSCAAASKGLIALFLRSTSAAAARSPFGNGSYQRVFRSAARCFCHGVSSGRRRHDARCSRMLFCLPRAWTWLANSEAVNPSDRAMTASITQRRRALLRSFPPTLVLPTREGAGSCSSMRSAMKH